jgi:DNA-binding MarR family transcriptional regulator
VKKVKQVDPSADFSADRALAHLHFAFRSVIEKPDAILAKRGYSRVHHRILYFVRTHDGVDVGGLLAILGVTKQALHAPLGELVDGGLVSSTPVGRRRELRLTARGVALEDQLSGLQRDAFTRAFAAAGGTKAKAAWFAVMRELAGGGALPDEA